MAVKIATTITLHDLLLDVRAVFQPGAPEQGPSYASGGQPAEPPSIEDPEAVGLFWEVLVPAPPAERGSHPNGVWERKDLLEGLDDASRAKVLASFLRHLPVDDLRSELMDAVPEGEDPDDARDSADEFERDHRAEARDDVED